ncbi:thioredoxin domain-containing protein [Candidatus Woesearchaeota archaeon]|nr:thioredoxin domain-containing protein [Candidatus Woesearchaeota archaeon]
MKKIIIILFICFALAQLVMANECPYNEYNDDDPVLGDKNAPISIVWFGDYQEPFSAKFYKETLHYIKKDYIGTGKAKLVYRDYPLAFHPQAQKAAEAAECADEQGKFWEYHTALFNYNVLNTFNNLNKKLDTTTFRLIAKEKKLNINQFTNCLIKGKYQDEVTNDMNDAINLGIYSVPYFLINGEEVSGAQPYSKFKKEIDKALDSCYNLGYELNDFPDFLETNGKFDGIIVIGISASASYIIAANDILASLQKEMNVQENIMKLDSEIPNIYAQNMIVIGNSCVNAVTAALHNNPEDCKNGLEPGKGKIKLIPHQNGKYAIIVEGYSDDDTFAAAKVLTNLDNFDVKGDEFEVITTI